MNLFRITSKFCNSGRRIDALSHAYRIAFFGFSCHPFPSILTLSLLGFGDELRAQCHPGCMPFGTILCQIQGECRQLADRLHLCQTLCHLRSVLCHLTFHVYKSSGKLTAHSPHETRHKTEPSHPMLGSPPLGVCV